MGYQSEQNSDAVTTYRLLIDHGDQIAPPDGGWTVDEEDGVFGCLVNPSLESYQWLWVNAALITSASRIVGFRITLLQRMLGHYAFESLEKLESLTAQISALVDYEMKNLWLQGKIATLNWVFTGLDSQLGSQTTGSAYLNLILRLGFDIETHIAMEIRRLPNGLLGKFPWSPDRSILFEKLDGHWILRWEWVLESCQPGYILVSEHVGLGPDSGYWDEFVWPCCHDVLATFELRKIREKFLDSDEPTAQFGRRMATKTRKERARTGQKRPRSRMPGAWI